MQRHGGGITNIGGLIKVLLQNLPEWTGGKKKFQ
jgi:hypothetical protein